MKENLVPEKRVDKNGQLTTRWVKSDASGAKNLSSVPVPSLAVASVYSPAYKLHEGFLPTGKQMRTQFIITNTDSIDRRLPAQRKPHNERNSFAFQANDVEVYDVLSVTRDHATAAVLLSEGVRSKEEAITFLKNIDAEVLLDDRSELAVKALTRRIGSQELLEFGRFYKPELWHSGDHLDRYLDAVEAHSFPKFQYKTGAFFSQILNGKIRFDDVKTIGIRTCSRILLRDNDFSPLNALVDGSANYTAEQLRDAFKTADGCYSTYDDIVRMAQAHGGEWASSIDWRTGILASNAIPNAIKRNGAPRREKEFIEYALAFSKDAQRNYKELYDLFVAGVDVDFAVEKSEGPDAYSVDQIIAMQEGVPAPVVKGWL